MARSYWIGALVGMLACTAPSPARVQTQERIVTVQETNKPALKCRIVKCWRDKDGNKVCQVQAIDTGEMMTILEPGTGAPERKGKPLAARIFHWGDDETPPAGVPTPPANAVELASPAPTPSLLGRIFHPSSPQTAPPVPPPALASPYSNGNAPSMVVRTGGVEESGPVMPPTITTSSPSVVASPTPPARPSLWSRLFGSSQTPPPASTPAVSHAPLLGAGPLPQAAPVPGSVEPGRPGNWRESWGKVEPWTADDTKKAAAAAQAIATKEKASRPTLPLAGPNPNDPLIHPDGYLKPLPGVVESAAKTRGSTEPPAATVITSFQSNPSASSKTDSASPVQSPAAVSPDATPSRPGYFSRLWKRSPTDPPASTGPAQPVIIMPEPPLILPTTPVSTPIMPSGTSQATPGRNVFGSPGLIQTSMNESAKPNDTVPGGIGSLTAWGNVPPIPPVPAGKPTDSTTVPAARPSGTTAPQAASTSQPPVLQSANAATPSRSGLWTRLFGGSPEKMDAAPGACPCKTACPGCDAKKIPSAAVAASETPATAPHPPGGLLARFLEPTPPPTAPSNKAAASEEKIPIGLGSVLAAHSPRLLDDEMGVQTKRVKGKPVAMPSKEAPSVAAGTPNAFTLPGEPGPLPQTAGPGMMASAPMLQPNLPEGVNNAFTRGTTTRPIPADDGLAFQSQNAFQYAGINQGIVRPQPMQPGRMGPPVMQAAYFPRPMPMAPPVAQASYLTPQSMELMRQATTTHFLIMLRSALIPSEREMAVEQLLRCNWRTQPEVPLALVQAAKTDPAATVRASCVRALTQMKVNSPTIVQAVAALKNDSDASVRQEVVQAMAVLSKP